MKFHEEYEEVLKIMTGIWGDAVVEGQRNNIVLQILASIPFYAGSSNPMRVATSCINNYFLYAFEDTRKYFNHQPSDDQDLYSRLSLLYVIPSGDHDVIEKGRILLSLIMLQDHMADCEADMMVGKYNPVASGAWDYNEIRNALLSKASSISVYGMDDDFPLGKVSICNYWEEKP